MSILDIVNKSRVVQSLDQGVTQARRLVFETTLHAFNQLPAVKKTRERVVSPAKGDVLEVACGAGPNVDYYSDQVTRLTLTDAHEEMLAQAKNKLAGHNPLLKFDVACAVLRGENLPFNNESFDTVILTFGLCSIPDPIRALHEVVRVLRKGGNLLFLDHGRSPDPVVAKIQDWIDPLQVALACGCHVNRAIKDLIIGSGLELTKCQEYYFGEVPPLLGPQLYFSEGKATKRL